MRATAERQVRIERPALTAGLDAALRNGDVVVTAGAGFGKTTAVELALARLGWPTARIPCSAQSRDAGQLLAAIVEGLQRAEPGVADVVAERLGAAPTPLDIPSTTAALLAELETLAVDPIVVFLDDAESLAGATDALDLVSALLGRRAERLRVVLASRRPLQLRRAKLRAAGGLTELGERELAFTEEECAEYLRARLDRGPEPSEVGAVMAVTEGWPLGVALSARGSMALPAPTARDELFEYLAEEVLDRLEPPMRAEALASSLLAELDAARASALGLGPEFVERARAQGLFLEPVGSGEERWRYHPLFREFLRARLHAERSAGEVGDLHRAAAVAERDAGRPAVAVDLLLDGGRYQDAAALVAAVGLALMRTSWRTVGDWLDRIPPELRDTPPLRLLAGQVLLARGDQPAADALLRSAADGFRAAGDVAGQWAARWVRGGALHEVGRWDLIAELADDFDEDIARSAGLPAIALALYAAGMKAAQGDIEGGEALAARALAAPGGELARPIGPQFRAYVDVAAGRGDSVRDAALGQIAHLERSDPLGNLGTLQATIALVAVEHGHRDEALDYWTRVVETVERAGTHRGLAVLAQLWRTMLLARSGRVAEAERALAEAEPLPEMGFRVSWAHQARASLAWARGDAAAAVAAAEGAFAALRDVISTADRSWVLINALPVLGDAGELASARSHVEDALGFWEAVLPGDRGRYWHARTLADRAWVRHAQGEAEDAVADLRAAWDEAGDVVVDMLRCTWPRVRPVISDALESGALDPSQAVPTLRAVQPSGEALVAFLEHPAAEVREAAIGPAARSGHPDAIARLRSGRTGERAGARVLDDLRDRPLPLAFTVLGGFALERGEWEVRAAEWTRPIAAALVRFLLVHRDAAVPEDDLFAAFWPDRSERSARSNLQVALSQARSVLDVPGAESHIVTTQRTYRLRLGELDRVDAEEFVATAEAARGAPDAERIEALERAAALWTGAPLPEDRYADWSLAWRNELIDRYAGVLAALARARLRAGDAAGAVAAGRRRVELEPLDESAHADLMVAYARAGRRGHALRQFLVCRRVLVDELGIEPSEAIVALQARVLAGETV